MLLQTDDQTIDDLRLFARRDQAGIYDIYNHATTRGGESLLEEMFRCPLSDREAITARAGIIADFAALSCSFPFAGALLDSAEKYISFTEESLGGQKAGLGEKEIQNGVMAMISLLHEVRRFLSDNGPVARVAGLSNERARMLLLLDDEALQPVFREKPGGKLSYAAITAFDVLLRIREKEKVVVVLQFIYLVDVYLSVARVARERDFVFPLVHPKGSAVLKVEGVYHPELKDPVANDLSMDSQRNIVFLTGANMAGKSTFLRALSTALYVAHMGFPVAAGRMEFSVMDGIYTTINLPDNLGIGASHFYAEVLRVKKIATELAAGRSLFVLFDELFRGTNVKDAYEGTVEVIRSFARRTTSMFIVSSHIVEAGAQLEQLSNIGFHFLPTRMNGHRPEYTYTLQEGITADRHGMIIIRNEGILDILKNGKKRG